MTKAIGVWALRTPPVLSFPQSALPLTYTLCPSHTELLEVPQMHWQLRTPRSFFICCSLYQEVPSQPGKKPSQLLPLCLSLYGDFSNDPLLCLAQPGEMTIWVAPSTPYLFKSHVVMQKYTNEWMVEVCGRYSFVPVSALKGANSGGEKRLANSFIP